jgi:arylsulfatase A-like enzyme
LVSCDSLRADHLSCYGYSRKTSPVLDAFAAESVMFEEAMSQETWTLTSHMSMLTGLYPKNHGLSMRANLAPQHVTLPELLKGPGYRSAGFTGILWSLEGWRGYQQGFDVYDTASPYRTLADTVTRVSQWLDGNGTEPFFLFIHNYDVHAKPELAFATSPPYMPDDPRFLTFTKAFDPPPDILGKDVKRSSGAAYLDWLNRKGVKLTEHERAYIVALYDDSIVQMDHAMGLLFDELRRRGLYDRAMIIVTADHGDMFGEHGMYLHEQIYRGCAHVPLLIHFPGGRFAGRRVKHVVQSVDIFPTIAEVLGIKPGRTIDGQSLLALLEGRAQPRKYAFTRGDGVYCARDATWEYLLRPADGFEEFYNIAEDPGELRNRAAERLREMQAYRKEAEAYAAPDPAGWHVRVHNPNSVRTTLYLKLKTEDAFACVEYVPQMRGGEINTSEDGKVASGSVSILPNETWEIVIRNSNPTVPIKASIKSTQILLARIVTAENLTVMNMNVVLDPADAKFLTVPPSETEDKYTTAIWYVPPKPEGEPARALTPSEVDAMKALGYLR